MWTALRGMWQNACQWLQSTLRRRRPGYTAAVSDDPPDVVAERTLHLVGESGDYWLAVMKCPCGCGADIQLAMSSNSRPRWAYIGPSSEPTLTPSVWRKSGCKSHFVLRRGKVIWCN